MTALTTDRLIRRPLVPQGAEAFISLRMSPPANRIGRAASRADAWRAFAVRVGNRALRACELLTIEGCRTGAILGSTGPWFAESPPRQTLGASLRSDVEERGIATEAGAARGQILHRLGWQTLVSHIAPANARSTRRTACLVAQAGPTSEALRGCPTHRYPTEVRP